MDIWRFIDQAIAAWNRRAAPARPELTDEQLAAANAAYTQVLFPECTPQQLADEWARMTPSFRANTQEAMRAAIVAALSIATASPEGGPTGHLDELEPPSSTIGEGWRPDRDSASVANGAPSLRGDDIETEGH
jgi:hypothetical protein